MNKLGEFLKRHQLAVVWWVLLILTGAMGVWANAECSNPGQTDVQLAGTPGQLAIVFAKLADKGGFEPLRQSLTIDTWLLIPLYVALLVVSIELARRQFAVGADMRQVGGAFLMIVGAAGILDLFENHNILRLISDDSLLTAGPQAISANDASVITRLALAKYVMLVFVGLYFLATLLTLACRFLRKVRRRQRARKAEEGSEVAEVELPDEPLPIEPPEGDEDRAGTAD